MNLKKFKAVERWLRHVFSSGTKSEATEITYLHFLGKFCEFTKLDPDKLIEHRREDLASADEMVQRKHEELLKKWMMKMEENGLSRNTAITGHNSVKSFYYANYVPLISKSPKSWTTREKKVPSREELKKMIHVCRKIRDKAVIMSLAQSGASVKEFVQLITFDTIRDEYDGGIEPLHLLMKRSTIEGGTKRTQKYDTFLGSDAVGFLREYLGKLPKKNAPVFGLAKRTVEHVVEQISKRAGLKPHVTPHGLRTFFNTAMVLSFHEAQAQHIPLVDYWMGHVLPYKGAYLVPPVEDQRKLYKKHEWAVSLP